jgi:hypothetical protein
LTEICIFAGPTTLQRIPEGAHVFEPAALGSVFRAVQAGYKTICLIDGYFGNRPSVWHKEILFALKNGVKVCGSSSMGALRAAELHDFGMIGFGWIYRAFRRGLLCDDDEVCVLHAVSELNFAPLSEAMVNIRCSLRGMRKRGQISLDSERRVAQSLKAVHFTKRDSNAIHQAFMEEFGMHGTSRFDLYEKEKIDIKSADADMMLNAVVNSAIPECHNAWQFPTTNHWLYQFVVENADIPALSRWHPVAPTQSAAAPSSQA